jgi:Spy/CpxP family protein refolding chaperone
MRLIRSMVGAAVAASLSLAVPATAGDGLSVVPAFHDELRRGLDELAGHMQGFAGQMHGLGAQWRDHLAAAPEGGPERPLISIALAHRAELGLSPGQVEALERLRADFQREAIRREADLRVAEMDVAALRRAEPVDLAQVEARVREAERLRADLRVARIRTIEQGRAQLTPEQREKLREIAAGPGWPMRPRAGGGTPAPPPPRQRM